MPFLRRTFPVWAVVGLMLLGQGSQAADEGFKPLFNGKDLTGWVVPDDASLFAVDDGAIVGRTKGDLKINQFLVTDRPYGDFHLKAKIKLRNGNSGIQFRSKRSAENGACSGPQADVADGYWGLLYEERGRGILDRESVEKAKEIVRKDDWNEYEIIAKGDHVTILLNGTKVIDRTDEKFDKDGIIALQVHVGPAMEVRFKDLLIKPLDGN